MTVLEEQYTGASDIDKHALFNPDILVKKRLTLSAPGTYINKILIHDVYRLFRLILFIRSYNLLGILYTHFLHICIGSY